MSEEGSADRVAVVAASPGSYALEAVVSTVLRVLEEYSVSRVILVGMERARGFLEEASKTLSRVIPDLEVEYRLVCDWLTRRECSAEWELRKIVIGLCSEYGEESIVVAFSPGSRRLAAATAMSGLAFSVKDTVATSSCMAEVVHVDFLFGPWSGATYPYTPRALEPVIRVHPVLERLPQPRNRASGMPDLPGSGCRDPLGRSLPPLRCSVLELARRINAAPHAPRSIIDPPSGRVGSCGELRVTIESDLAPGYSATLEVSDACDLEDLREKIPGFLGALCGMLETVEEKVPDPGFGTRRWALRQLLYLSGLAPPIIREAHGPDSDNLRGLRLKNVGRPVVPDTNLVYSGLHNEAYQGLRVRLPYCVVYEILSRYAEALKNPNAPSSILESMAYLAFEELQSAGAEMIPSPSAPHCEAVTPGIDPLLLRGTVAATRDTGAFRLWKLHPSMGASGEVSVALLDSPGCHEARERASSLTHSEAYYGLLQLIVLLRMLSASKLRVQGKHRRILRVSVSVDDKRVQVPAPAPGKA